MVGMRAMSLIDISPDELPEIAELAEEQAYKILTVPNAKTGDVHFLLPCDPS
jgi:hypothetical protein